MSQKKVIITADSTNDLSLDLIKKHNIKIKPLTITLGEHSYSDGVDIDPDFIYKYHAEHGILPKTSAVNIAEMIDFFKPLVDEGYAIVHFALSSYKESLYRRGPSCFKSC